MTDQIRKAAVLLEALPYIQNFRGHTFLIKVGGSAMEEQALVDSLLRDIVFLEAVGINPVLVHGGGKAINKAMKQAGLETKFVNGLRVTDEATIRIVEQTLADTINPDLVQRIKSVGGKAIGVSGTSVFVGNRLNEELGYVGEVVECHADVIDLAIAGEVVPVVSPI